MFGPRAGLHDLADCVLARPHIAAKGEQFWLAGPHRDRRDTRYSDIKPEVDEDVTDLYEAFLAGAPLVGRERG